MHTSHMLSDSTEEMPEAPDPMKQPSQPYSETNFGSNSNVEVRYNIDGNTDIVTRSHHQGFGEHIDDEPLDGEDLHQDEGHQQSLFEQENQREWVKEPGNVEVLDYDGAVEADEDYRLDEGDDAHVDEDEQPDYHDQIDETEGEAEESNQEETEHEEQPDEHHSDCSGPERDSPVMVNNRSS